MILATFCRPDAAPDDPKLTQNRPNRVRIRILVRSRPRFGIRWSGGARRRGDELGFRRSRERTGVLRGCAGPNAPIFPCATMDESQKRIPRHDPARHSLDLTSVKTRIAVTPYRERMGLCGT